MLEANTPYSAPVAEATSCSSEAPFLKFVADILMVDGTWRRVVYDHLCRTESDRVAFATGAGAVAVARKSDMEGLHVSLLGDDMDWMRFSGFPKPAPGSWPPPLQNSDYICLGGDVLDREEPR